MRHRFAFPGPRLPAQPAVAAGWGRGEVAESSRTPTADNWAANHFAVTHLAYDARQLSKLPRSCATAFRGVANPHRVGPIAGGDRVLDHACGGGLDLLLAALRFGARGVGIGVEQDPALLDCAQQCAQHTALGASGAAALHWLQGTPASLPIPSQSVDVVLSNGVLGGPHPQAALRELVRVLRPGGRLHLAVRVGLEASARLGERESPPWVGEPVAPLLYEVGFRRVQLVERFSLGSGPQTVGESFLAHV